MKIEKLRSAIDVLDQKLLDILSDRADLAKEIGKIKHSSGQQIYAPQREKNIIASMVKKKQRQTFACCGGVRFPGNNSHLSRNGR